MSDVDHNEYNDDDRNDGHNDNYDNDQEDRRDERRYASETRQDATEKPPANVYVASLAFETNEETLRNVFSKFGTISSVEVIRAPGTNQSRGFGFVTFESADAASAATSLNGTELDRRNIRVELAKRTSGYSKTPGKYLGPPSARVNYRDRDGGYNNNNDRFRGGDRGRSRERGAYPGGGGGGGGRGRSRDRDDNRWNSSRPTYDSRGPPRGRSRSRSNERNRGPPRGDYPPPRDGGYRRSPPGGGGYGGGYDDRRGGGGRDFDNRGPPPTYRDDRSYNEPPRGRY